MARGINKLKRKKPAREERQRFFLFCEGQNTEPEYFKALKNSCTGAMISIECVAPAGVPETLTGLAKKRQKQLNKEKRKNKSAQKDSVWAVFDKDEHPNVANAIQVCESADVGLAYSNPCFEVWLLLHHEDHHASDDRHEVQQKYANIDPDYDANNRKIPNCNALIRDIEVAENRAENQCSQRELEGAVLGRPCTTVYKLTRAIRAAAKAAKP